MRELANLGIDRSALLGALQCPERLRPSGVVQTQDEKFSLRVSGAFQSEADLLEINFPSATAWFAWPTSPPSSAASRTLRSRVSVNGQPAIGLGIAMRDGGDILALGANIKKAMARIIRRPAPSASTATGRRPVGDGRRAIADFMSSLWQAVGIILVISFISLGVRAGSGGGPLDPADAAVVFAVMNVIGIDMQRISLGALIIALALLVDDAMTTTDAMVTRLAAGDEKAKAATFAFDNMRRDVRGHAGDDRRLRADRLRRQLGRRIHLLALRGGEHRARRLLVRRCDLRARSRHGAARRAEILRTAAGPLADRAGLPGRMLFGGDPGAAG